MRKLVVALTAGAIGAGVIVSSAAAQPTDEPGEPTCQAAVISYAVQVGTRSTSGRRAAAEVFFGDADPDTLDPKAVQDAERAVQDFCAS
jgi:hypothetical protein